jgi:hypothetical protein
MGAAAATGARGWGAVRVCGVVAMKGAVSVVRGRGDGCSGSDEWVR